MKKIALMVLCLLLAVSLFSCTTEDANNNSQSENGTQAFSGQGKADPVKEETEPIYSSVSYAPPYYVPNFTVGTGIPVTPQKNETRPPRTVRPWVLVLSIVLCIGLSLILGGAAGYYGAMLASRDSDLFPPSYDDGSANIIKNNGSIELDETLTSDVDVYTEVSSVAKAVADSVVEITTSQIETHPFYGQYITSGAGSGVIIAQTETVGVIVTNYHVVANSDDITVRLTNGSEYRASYRGGEESMDIAVLYIALQDGEELSCATFGDSDRLIVGQRVVAIGNPLGSLGGTVTDGIISALDRQITIDDHQMTLLQTNTAINPGNSGGGLFDMAGRLVGIVNAKQSASGIEGLGFAIPINVIESAIASITEFGYVQNRPTLGVDVFYSQNEWINGTYSNGVYVSVVYSDTSSFRQYDCIVSINGNAIDSKIAYNLLLEELTIGEEVTVVVERVELRQRVQRTVKVTVTENTRNH